MTSKKVIVAKPQKMIDWTAIRQEWSADPSLSFGALQARLGISKQAIGKRARKEGWERVDTNDGEVKKAIKRVADEKSADIRPPSMEVLDAEEKEPPGVTQFAKDVAVEARAAVIDRHRREWNLPRNALYQALQAGNFEKLKQAKITAESFAIIQANERKAWGLDGEKTLTVRVIPSRRDVCD